MFCTFIKQCHFCASFYGISQFSACTSFPCFVVMCSEFTLTMSTIKYMHQSQFIGMMIIIIVLQLELLLILPSEVVLVVMAVCWQADIPGEPDAHRHHSGWCASHHPSFTVGPGPSISW